MKGLIKRTALCLTIIFFTVCSWAANPQTYPETKHHRAAEKALKKGKEDKASRELKLALQADPLDSRAHYMLAVLLARKGEEDQAMVGFRRAIMTDPTHTEALHNLGTLLLQRGEAVPAAEVLEAAVNNDPDYIPAYNSLAKAYFLAELPELSIATYKEVLRRDASNSTASQNLALLVAQAQPETETTEQPKPDGTEGKSIEEQMGEIQADLPVVDKPPDSADDSAKQQDGPGTSKAPPTGKDKEPGPASQKLNAEVLGKLTRDLPYLTVEEVDGTLALTGWTRDKMDREILNRILSRWPAILNLTEVDAGDPQRMLEVDVVLFVVTSQDSESIGFNFLRLVNVSYTYFNANNNLNFPGDGAWKGVAGAPNLGSILKIPHWGSLFVASVDYDVNIANASDDRVAVLARPHLTTLNGTPANFLAGGEIVFRVSGIKSGDIKPYPFGTSLTVTPTLLRTPGRDGTLRVHLNIQAQRTSVLEFLTAQSSEDEVVFDKLTVNSQAILDLGQTLILSGLNQREARTRRSGVPILKEIPLLKYFFSQKTTVEDNTAVIILLTPRDPAYNDDQNRRSLAAFVQKRRAFVEATQGTEQEMLRFHKRYPDYKRIAPNRYASHFFLLESSDLYRRVSGEDLIDEDLDLHLLEGEDERDRKEKDEEKEDGKEENGGEHK